MATYTNFCCRSGGSNMNAGAVDGSTTEPSTSALVTYTGGNWDSTTDIFTAALGADMTEAVVGRFASLYNDGDTSPTANQYLVGRITVVNAGTRQITLSTTARTQLGTEVATGTGNRSLRVGGAWAGPSGASGFPLTFITSALADASGNAGRVNLKNDQTYSITAQMSTTASMRHLWGYTTTYGDGGRAVIDGGTSGASYLLLDMNGVSVSLVDLEFRNNGATGNANGLNMSGVSGNVVRRCVFHAIRGAGSTTNSTGTVSGNTFVECEWYACNQSNTANVGAANITAGAAVFDRCIFHDNAGANVSGMRSATGATVMIDCVSETNGLNGATFALAGKAYGCDFYNNGGAGISAVSETLHAENCNFLKNTTYGVNNAALAFLVNCGYGSGTQANTSGTVASTAIAEETGAITYASGVTPWTDPDNGDFRITLAAAKGAGRGSFLQTATSYAGTVAYPDVGAGQSLGLGASGSRIFSEGLNVIPVPQSTTRRVMLKLYLTGTTTAATSKTAAVTLSKAGAAFANPSAGATNATELSSGWYYVDLSTTDTATLGDLIVKASATGCDDAERMLGVVKATNAGWTALPDAAAEASGGLYTRGSGAGQIAQAANGQINVNLDTIKTQAVTCGAGVTVPALIASTTNITAGTLTTVTTATNVTTVNGLAAAVITATSIAADAITAAKIADGAIDTATFATGTTIPRVTLADTATNLTNAAGAGDFTTTMKASIGTAVAASAVASVTAGVTVTTNNDKAGYSLSQSFPANFAALGINASGHVSRVTLADAVTTYTGNTPQTGDSYAVVNSGTYGNAALNTLLAAVAGYVDTEVAAIKAKTDNLPASPAAAGDAMALTSGERNSTADALLKRDWTAVSGESSFSTLNALRMLRNVWDITAGTLTVRAEDGTAVAWTHTVSTTPGANPVTSVS